MTLHAADAAAQVQTETDLESIVREQIEAYAKSIDQNDATNKASKALASHGISGRGKKLSVGKNHALTATLINSEVVKALLTDSFVEAFKLLRDTQENSVSSGIGCGWHTGEFFYEHRIPKYKRIYCNPNTCDKNLAWIVGSARGLIAIERIEVTADDEIYEITFTVRDRFDFSGEDGAVREDMFSVLGSIFFREFDWESKVTFQLTVPNECEHSYKTKTTKPTCTAKGYTTYTCELCGCSYKADYTAKLSHKYDGETDRDCNTCGAVRFIRGDMNGDGEKTTADAIYLLRHSILAENYPVSQSADMNGDGTVSSADAVYLLRHIIMPKEYPLA